MEKKEERGRDAGIFLEGEGKTRREEDEEEEVADKRKS